jgi:hypothetical protein
MADFSPFVLNLFVWQQCAHLLVTNQVSDLCFANMINTNQHKSPSQRRLSHARLFLSTPLHSLGILREMLTLEVATHAVLHSGCQLDYSLASLTSVRLCECTKETTCKLMWLERVAVPTLPLRVLYSTVL